MESGRLKLLIYNKLYEIIRIKNVRESKQLNIRFDKFAIFNVCC